MRVLYIVNGLRLGGMERQLCAVILEMKQQGHETFLAVLNAPGPFSAVVEQYLTQPIFYLDRRKTRVVNTILNLIWTCKRVKPEIVHVQDSFSAFYAIWAAKFLGIKLVNGSIRHAGVNLGFSYYYEKTLLKCSDLVIANSCAGLDYYSINGEVVYNFIDTKRFNRSEAPLSKVVMNANFSDYKDQLTLLMAGRKLIKDGLVSEIGFIGEGKHKQFYQDLAEKLGISMHIRFWGHVTDIESVLLNYGIGVLCSTIKYKEGISNSILEYMGSGLIAVASDVGATREIIENGQNGFLFAAETQESLYQKVKSIIEYPDQRDMIRQNAYHTLSEKFDPSLNCKKLISLYQDQIKGLRV